MCTYRFPFLHRSPPWRTTSQTARRPRAIINEASRASMKSLLANIQSGAFAEDWIEENHNNRPRFNKMRSADTDHKIEVVGRELRRMMPFVNPREVIPGQGGS